MSTQHQITRYQIRRHLIIYRAAGPVLAASLTILVFALIVSLFSKGDLGAKLRALGLIQFGVAMGVSLIRSAIIIWKTRNVS
jgi:hypothetical protein